MKFWFCIIRAKAAPPRWRDKSAAASRAVAGMQARLRTVPPLTTTIERLEPSVPDEGPPYATHEDLVALLRPDSRQPDALRQHGGAR